VFIRDIRREKGLLKVHLVYAMSKLVESGALGGRTHYYQAL
jgi:hypothetical protein